MRYINYISKKITQNFTQIVPFSGIVSIFAEISRL